MREQTLAERDALTRRLAPRPWQHPAVVGKHLVCMTRDYPEGVPVSVATCQCGWVHRMPAAELAKDPPLGDRAVEAHWYDVIDAAEGEAA
jgi:hypothetical protein